jgi:hypothetical protein
VTALLDLAQDAIALDHLPKAGDEMFGRLTVAQVY